MKNETQHPNNENSDQKQVFGVLHEIQDGLEYELYGVFQKIMENKDNPEELQELNILLQTLTMCINMNNKLVNTKNTMLKRENIEARGFDTNAAIAARNDKEEREAKRQNTNKTLPDPPEKTDPDGDSQPEEQTDENAQKIKHLHSDIKEYQDALPEPHVTEDTEDDAEDEQKKLPSIITQKPPIIAYNPKGFRPHGQMQDLFKSHATVKMVGGTYDAGKTYSCIAYIDLLARKYPGARLTFIHRSLNRVRRNIIPSYEKYLGFRPKSISDPNPTPITRYGGEHTEFFEYWNGSRIYINGLDKPENLLSDFYDAAFVNEAELLPFSTWDELTARVSERAGAALIAFLLGDCNPEEPNHWIRQQTKSGKLKYFEMTFRDNPEIYNQETGELTKIGKRRVKRLQDLEGLRYKRGYEGKWESAEGLVFDTFMPEVHIVDNFEMDPEWARYISIDWGFRNPCSCIWWARTPDDRIYAYKEIYKMGLTKPDFIRMIKENIDTSEKIRYAAVDSADQDGVSQLRKAGIRVEQPKKSRITQIDAIKERLRVDATIEPSIFFLRDRLVHPPDQDLKDAYRPLEVTDEFLSCTYDENTSGTNKDDEAIKGDNHGIDSTAYFILSLHIRKYIGSGRVIYAAIGMK